VGPRKVTNASSQPFSKGEGLKISEKYILLVKVLSFGEDLGEAKRMLSRNKI
jgi:hypothetical protein